MYRFRGLLTFALLVGFSFPASVIAVGETPSSSSGGGTCPAGSRIATASDAAVKNGTIKAGTCYNPNDVGISQNAEEAKAALRKILCAPDSDNYGGAGADGTINGLNPAFASCAAKFLTDAKKQMPSLCLKEGYRTVQKQNEYAQRVAHGSGGMACSKGANCEHPSGIAIDVNVSSDAEYMKLWNDASNYGLIFYLRDKDKVHFVPIAAKGGSRTGACMTSGYSPTGASPTAGPGGVSGGQSAPIGYGQQAGQGMCPTGYVSYNGQCYALQNNQPLGAAQQPMQYMPQQQQQQNMPQQTSTPLPTQPETSLGSTNTNTNTSPFNTNTSNNSSSTIDLLALINGTATSTAQADAIRAILNSTTTDKLDAINAILNGTAASSGDNMSTTSTFVQSIPISIASFWEGLFPGRILRTASVSTTTNTLTYEQPTASQDTFSSVGTGATDDYSPTSTSRLRTTLATLRRQLTDLLTLLGIIRGAPAQTFAQLPQPQLLTPAPGHSLEEQYGGE